MERPLGAVKGPATGRGRSASGGDQADELAESLAGDAANLVLGSRLHRMWQDECPELRVAPRPRRCCREVGKHLGHDHGSRDSLVLADYGVVDTPRRARPSGAETDDRGIHGTRKL